MPFEEVPPYYPADDLPILTDEERELVLVRWNDTARDFPREDTLHGLFEETVRECSDQIALVFEGQSLSYSKLNARANRLARFLRARGVGPDVPVGLCANRSPEMVIAMLAILKAGGAYVPLDPDHPHDRLKSIVGDAAPPVVLTQEHIRGRLDGLLAPVFRLDCDWPEIEHLDDSNPLPRASPSDLSYVIYTSGSTGTPKGAMNTHRGICNRLLWMQDAYPLTPEDRVLQKTPFSFDVSVWEFFWPLLVGARLVLAQPGGHRDPSYLAQRILDERITVVHFVPSMLQLFLEEPGLEAACRTLRHVFSSGEALPEYLARRCLERLPARLHNLYGPTEAAIDVTYRECRRDDPPGPVPIGRPIANMRTYVLDAHLQPQPVGIPGELFLAGVGLARGYLGRPDLTAERFLPDPFADDPDARMYRTGDLVRWRPDGELEFLGRLDHQVKVRGFRIELGEIEAALADVPGVRRSVVVAHEFKPGDTRLVAYVVADAVDLDAIRTHLALKLPEYMLPSVFVRLDAIPLTPSGKVDRKALPTPELEQCAGTTCVPPRDPLEVALASIWQDLLGVERIGIHDDFFRLGGHSLLAARAVARAATVAGVDVPLRTLFECPTIAGMAAAISATRGCQEAPESVAAVNHDIDVLPSFAQQRLWFIDQLEGPGLSAYNIATATRLEGDLDTAVLRLALQDVVARHEPLRTSFALREGQPVQVIHPPQPLDLPIYDIRHLEEHDRIAEADRLARAEADVPFDLAADTLLRALLICTDDRQHILLVTVHHIAADAWSLNVLWSELAQAYSARKEGRTPELPELPVCYADYAAWQRRLLVGHRLERTLSYWRDRLSGLEPLAFPTDRPRPQTLSYRGDHLHFEIPASLVGRLRLVCQEASVTPHMAFLGAFQATLGRLTGRDDLAVGIPIAGRPRPELENLIGFFVNTLVMRADLSGALTFRELLARTRNASLDAYDHQDLPFERLVQELQPERQRNQNPLFRVFFQLLDAPRLDFSQGGLLATPISEPLQRVRFDLEMMLEPRGDSFVATFRYSTDLYDRETIERLAGHYHTLLEAAVADPDTPLDDLPILTDQERERLLVDWNATVADYPRDATIHDLYREQATRSPDAVALIFGPNRMTYAELDCRSERLASRLRSLGGGPEMVVALCLPRSTEQVITLLGILKAGSAYLPLDPANPPGRNGFLLRDSGAVAVVTRRDMLAKFSETEIPTVMIEDLGDAGGDEPITRVEDCGTSARCLAYVIYTSGSTGEPKGVMVEHRSVARLVMGQRYATFGPDRVFLQLAPVAFDASTFEIWGSLLHGGTLVIAPEGPIDFARLRDLIVSHEVTTLWLTAGLFNSVVEAHPDALSGVSENPHWW